MYVECNIVARSCNHWAHGNAKINAFFTVELRISRSTLYNIAIVAMERKKLNISYIDVDIQMSLSRI
jgi:hypothetical protein